MNDYYKKRHLLFLGLGLIGLILYVLIRYGLLAGEVLPDAKGKLPLLERGSIVDRNGKPLAVQTNFYHVGVSPQLIKNKEKFALDIASSLTMTPKEILKILEANEKSTFCYIKKRINQTTYDELKKITTKEGYTFVSYDKIPGRVYPENSLGSQLIGYIGSEGRGLAGIEYSMQEYLEPVIKDQNKIEAGKNVFLTIDANLQYKLEELARDTMMQTQAENMMILACDAKNGEILSYISLPSFNLNEFNRSKESQRTDRPAMVSYEPGSVFKIFTVALTYDRGLINQESLFLCDGLYSMKMKGGETIRIKCLEHHGWISPREALKYSCNDALAQISDTINEEDFIAAIRSLGFGSKTEIELPGEALGYVKEPFSKTWSGRSKPTIAIGQEISVSALQMMQAATAISNKGVPLKLSVVRRITNKDGSIFYEHKATPKSRVFSEETASYVLSCMGTTATSGTGIKARLNDISIGVKTGTAQMADKNGGYSTTDFLSNCIAIFPLEEPEIILYIVVEKAKGETYAGRIVAPVIAKAADTIIDHLGMSRGDAASLEHNGRISITRGEVIEIGEVVPDFTGMSKKDLMNITKRNDIQLKINGSGWVKSQEPEAGSPIIPKMIIELNLE